MSVSSASTAESEALKAQVLTSPQLVEKTKKTVIPLSSSKSSSSSSSSEGVDATPSKKKVRKDDQQSEKKKKTKRKSMDHLSSSDVKTPKKAKRPEEKERKSPKKSSNREEEDDDEEERNADTSPKKTIPKKHQDILAPEMARLLSGIIGEISEKKVKSILKSNPDTYAKFVAYVKPYRQLWCFSTSGGRLFRFVEDKKSKDGGRFESILTNPGMTTLSHYMKKEEFTLDELYRLHVDKSSSEKNKDTKLFGYIETCRDACEPFRAEDKMHRGILHCPLDRKSYWVNTPEGREKLGLVVNTKIKKLDDDSIAKEAKNLMSIRQTILSLIKADDESPPMGQRSKEEKKNKKDKKKKTTSPEKKESQPLVPDKESSTKKKKKSDRSSASTTPSKHHKSPEKGKTPVDKEAIKTTPLKRKAEEMESPSRKKSVASTNTTPSPANKRVKKSEPIAQPSVTTTTTTLDIDLDIIRQIKTMSSDEIYAMLLEEKKKVLAIDKETLEKIEWYERYS